jgi:hypothetical protein
VGRPVGRAVRYGDVGLVCGNVWVGDGYGTGVVGGGCGDRVVAAAGVGDGGSMVAGGGAM